MAPKLNLGSGPLAAEGWINIDRSPNILLDRVRPVKRLLRTVGLLSDEHMVHWAPAIFRHDLSRGIPCADGIADAVYSSHMLEHMYLSDARGLLLETQRVLKSGAILRLALPDYSEQAQLLVTGEQCRDADAGMTFNRNLLAHPFERPSLYVRLRSVAGGHTHRWFPTRSLLRQLLAEARFTDIRELSFRRGELPDLVRIETRRDSLFFEAKAR
jgi:hypothetical protein